MRDIIREGNPTLHAVAEEVSVPITEEGRQLGEDMLTFLKNSQDPVKTEELQLCGGVDLAAPQLDISKRIIAVYVSSNDPENETPLLSTVMYNPKILSHSVQDVCSGEGEGCLPADRNMPGHVARHNKTTVSYFDMDDKKHKVHLKSYRVIIAQYEIDHINGIMFYGHINKENPSVLKEGALIIE